jgi:putative membrane protein
MSNPETQPSQSLENKFKGAIIAVSIIIPIAVAVLFSVKLKDFGFQVEPLSFLPPIYATINGITAILLILAVMAIKKGNRTRHEKLMTMAIACSVIFLVMYVAYHMTAGDTKFGDANGDGILDAAEKAQVGAVRFVYYFILITHILLSIIIIPMVLFTYVRALAEQFYRHKKLAKKTFPIWLYVAVTGVIVYLMISPYYVK